MVNSPLTDYALYGDEKPPKRKLRISLCWYWRNFWIGARYSGNRHAIYINFIPCLSLRVELPKELQ